ncbi:phage major capsid protein [Ralstonia sp. L16]|uniref:phage major capsid protein n=1 Tax=Ralstonia sp. L16 TaxID=3423950 RepID=UPI003F78E91D
MSLQAQRERRNALVQQAKHLNAEHGEKWTPELQKQYDALVTEIGQIDDSIARQQRLLDLEADKAFETLLQRPGAGGGAPSGEPNANNQYRRFLRDGMSALTHEELVAIRNTMSVGGAGSEGGYTVQTDIAKTVSEALKKYGGMRQVAEVIQTQQGNPINYPTSDGTAEEGEIISENTQATALDPSFGTKPLGVYKYSSKIIAVPFELLQDSAIDVEAFVNGRIVTRLGRITNKHFTIGTGVSQPTGIVTAAGVGRVGAAGQTTAVIYDDLVELQHSVDPAYREGGNTRFMMHDTSVKSIRKLKDANGRPLWVPDFDQGISLGMGGTLAGSPVTVNQHMPVMAANASSILFGDFSYYKIRDVMAITMFRFTDSVYTTKGQVGFLAWMRSGGNFIDVGGAVKAYQNSAT